MGYCSIADVQTSVGGAAKLAQLSDQDGALGGAINPTVVNAAILEATAEMSSYIGHRISVDAVAAVVPAVIKIVAARWAARALRRNLYNGQPLQDDLDREVIDRKWLEGVATGLFSLGVQPELPASDIVTDVAGTRDSTFIISRARLRGYS